MLDLHSAIMNIQATPGMLADEYVSAYKMGHKDARHAAAELAATHAGAAAEPVAWWIPEAEQFCMNTPEGRPFAKHWEPLYAAPPAALTSAPAVPAPEQWLAEANRLLVGMFKADDKALRSMWAQDLKRHIGIRWGEPASGNTDFPGAAPAETPPAADWHEPHPPSRQCMCPSCIPSFDDRFSPPAAGAIDARGQEAQRDQLKNAIAEVEFWMEKHKQVVQQLHQQATANGRKVDLLSAAMFLLEHIDKPAEAESMTKRRNNLAMEIRRVVTSPGAAGALPVVSAELDEYRQSLIAWAAERWNDEVKNRPMVNIHRRALDGTWRQVLRHLGVDDNARLGPTHDELRAEIGSKEWEAMNGKEAPAAADFIDMPEQESGWRDMATAPKDGTLLRLLVEFEHHATEDGEGPQATIGSNTWDNHHDFDEWQFAGWNWEQDCYTQGVGKPVGWLPMLDALPAIPAPEEAPAAARVLAFVNEYAKRRGLHPEEIYSLGLGDGALILTVSDLRTLAALKAAQPIEREDGK